MIKSADERALPEYASPLIMRRRFKSQVARAALTTCSHTFSEDILPTVGSRGNFGAKSPGAAPMLCLFTV